MRFSRRGANSFGAPTPRLEPDKRVHTVIGRQSTQGGGWIEGSDEARERLVLSLQRCDGTAPC